MNQRLLLKWLGKNISNIVFVIDSHRPNKILEGCESCCELQKAIVTFDMI